MIIARGGLRQEGAPVSRNALHAKRKDRPRAASPHPRRTRPGTGIPSPLRPRCRFSPKNTDKAAPIAPALAGRAGRGDGCVGRLAA
ncbi:hypothetical protein GCM10009800_10370 [Nocardiopsis rhodophaea]